MSKTLKVGHFRSLKTLAIRLRKDLRGVHARKKTAKRKGTNQVKGNDCVLLFAHNGVGKTRLSGEFKEIGKNGSGADTLYFNAFTEDLFDWDNDFEGDKERMIKFKSHSLFFNGLEGMGIDDQIRAHLYRHADFEFDMDFAKEEIRFMRKVVENGVNKRAQDIKISRGEENLFIWCFFLAVLQLAIEAEKGQPYDWVKYVYIDDPISSLDEHNTISVANHLASIVKQTTNGVKFVISTHHGLFFNVIFNELKGKRSADNDTDIKRKAYILHRRNNSPTYTLQDTTESPFLHHVVALADLKAAAKTGKISQSHCNMLRSILEKPAIFFGRQHISSCFSGLPKQAVYVRFLNVRSHAKFSVFEAVPIQDADKKMFREILNAFLDRYEFALPDVLGNNRSSKVAAAAASAPVKAAAKAAKKTAPKAPATVPNP